MSARRLEWTQTCCPKRLRVVSLLGTLEAKLVASRQSQVPVRTHDVFIRRSVGARASRLLQTSRAVMSSSAQTRCPHARQSRNGSNQHWNVVQCTACRRQLFAVFPRQVDKNELEATPFMTALRSEQAKQLEAKDKEISHLQDQLREATQRVEQLEAQLASLKTTTTTTTTKTITTVVQETAPEWEQIGTSEGLPSAASS